MGINTAKISSIYAQNPAVTPLTGNELLVGVQNGQSVGMKASDIGGLLAPATADTIAKSKYLLSATSQLFTFNGTKMRDIDNKNTMSLFRMPDGNLTSNYIPMTKAGAMTTATITQVNGFDNVVVGGSDQNSYIQFPFIFTNARTIYRMKLKINALGVTAPIVGFRNIWPGSSYSNFNNPQFYGFVNLLTGATTTTTTGTTITSTYNGWSGAAALNEIIEVELQYEQFRPRIFRIKKGTITTEYTVINQIKNTNADGDWAQLTQPAIILADGTYTILDYELLSMDSDPLILIDGDSMGTADRSAYTDTVAGKLEALIPYRIGCIAAGTKLLLGHLSTLWEAARLRPKYIALFHYLESCQGNANPASPNFATWSANFTKYVSTIKAMGMLPIFVHPQTWAVIDPTGTNSAFYTSYLATNYPSDINILVPTSQSFYDSTGFHYTGVTNGYIATQIQLALDSVL